MVMRLSGLSSGLDIDQWVTDIMKAQRVRVDQQYQKRQVLEWQRDDYRSINTKLLALRNASFDLKLQGAFAAKTASSSDDSVLTATAGSDALPANYTVRVNELAAGVTRFSSEALNSSKVETADGTRNVTLAEQFVGISETITFTLAGTVNGEPKEKTFTFNTGTANIYQVARAINDADIGVKAAYDGSLERFFLMTSDTGSQAKLHVVADDDNFLTGNLSLDVGGDKAESYGTDASINLNDAGELTFSSNQFTVNGINFDLKSKGTANVSVSNDVDAVMDKIKAFVTAYNGAVELMSDKLKEERHYDFPPLTDEQKKELEEDDIKKWEEKAKSGLLRGDALLFSVNQQLRSGTMARVEGLPQDLNNLSAIGITTQDYMEGGKLHIDEDKLRAALTSDLEGVMNLFTRSSEVESQRGIAARAYEAVNRGMQSITVRAGYADAGYDQSFMGEEIRRMDERINTMEARLVRTEERYYRQFTAMEQALQHMNMQSMWLTQQFASYSQ